MTIKISFYGATRRVGNPNTNLEQFFNSIYENAYDPSQIEVLYAIDKDDDLSYYEELKGKFTNKLAINFIVSEVRHGYVNLHLYYKQLFQLVSKDTRMLFGSSDDCKIVQKHFDKELLEIDKQHRDNIYFIHTRNTHRSNYLGDVTQNLLYLYWVQQAREPASYFPIISKKVLDISMKFAKAHDKKNEWAGVGNSWIFDCYIDILSVYISKLGLHRIHYFDNMVQLNENNKTAPHHISPQEHGLSPNNIGFIKMLAPETLQYMRKLAKRIYKEANKNMLAVYTLRTKRLLRRISFLKPYYQKLDDRRKKSAQGIPS